MAVLTMAETSRFFSRLPCAAVPNVDEQEDAPPLVFVLACGIVRNSVNMFGQMDSKFCYDGEGDPSEEAKGLAVFESLFFVSQCLGRFAFSEKTAHKRETFMDELTFTLHAILWQIAASDIEQQRFCLYFVDEYNVRANEYSRYEWKQLGEESRMNTPPYEYGKKLLKILWGDVDLFRLEAIVAIELRGLRMLIPLAESVIEKYEPASWKMGQES